jgi:hypothetical protein
VANGTYPVDIHCGDGPGIIFRRLDGTEVYAAPDGRPETRRWRPETPDDPTFYQVPYRALVPRGAENVLVAGRAVDADEGAFGAIRVMVNCNQLGQAAGVAAYLALQHRTPVCDVDPARLRRVLRRQGAAVI